MSPGIDGLPWGQTVPSIETVPAKPQAAECLLAYQVLVYTHDTSQSLLDAFADIRKARGAKGTPTDEEQDLLRAMLVFASAGLDSVAKQLIKDCLLALVGASLEVRVAFQRFVEKRVSGRASDEGAAIGVDARFIAAALLAPDTTEHLVDQLAADLTAGSLQSLEELKRVAIFLAADPKRIDSKSEGLREAFHARNQIIHEMDIDFSMKNRNRFSRTRDTMVKNTNALLDVTKDLLAAVDACLYPKS
jgi:hypothetical protein